ncbi:MAG: hypothetical protein JXB36_00940, partial [Gammaproteobacteria bacterium]|nr:hypothetical protein [Gammaproteobacteria bacterium]
MHGRRCSSRLDAEPRRAAQHPQQVRRRTEAKPPELLLIGRGISAAFFLRLGEQFGSAAVTKDVLHEKKQGDPSMRTSLKNSFKAS